MKKEEEQMPFEVEIAEEPEAGVVLRTTNDDESAASGQPAPEADSDVPLAELDDESASASERAQTGWRRLFQSEDLPQISLKEVLRGDFLEADFFRRQIWFFLLLLLLGIAYITNRYVAQQEIIHEENLRKELTERKNYALTQYSELTQQSRQSVLEQRLRANGDSTLTIPNEPPFFIRKQE